jgi:acyl-CoA thioester hydrolase
VYRNNFFWQDKETAMENKEFFSKTPVPVRYADTDQMGIAHHSNYAVWYEAGRTDFIKKLGYTYSGIEKEGVLLPLTDLECSFKRPAFYEDELTVITKLDSAGYVRAVFAYEVYNQEGALVSEGRTHHAWTDKALRPVNIKKKMPALYAKMMSLLSDNDNKPGIG